MTEQQFEDLGDKLLELAKEARAIGMNEDTFIGVARAAYYWLPFLRLKKHPKEKHWLMVDPRFLKRFDGQYERNWSTDPSPEAFNEPEGKNAE